MNLPSTDGVDVCAITVFVFRFGALMTIAFSTISLVWTALESTLGVRDTLVDFEPPRRNTFDMSELIELLQMIKSKIKLNNSMSVFEHTFWS